MRQRRELRAYPLLTMLNSAGVIKKAQRAWDRCLRAHASGEQLFPMAIPLAPPKSRVLIDDFERIHQWVRHLKAFAALKSLKLEFRAINHRQLGSQNLPVRICIPDMPTLVRLLDRQSVWLAFSKNLEKTKRVHPELNSWLTDKAQLLVKYQDVWDELLSVVAYFKVHPRPEKYIRELDIPGVDSKFIETNLGILHELLNECIADDSANSHASSAGTRNRMQRFCNRYHLKADPPLIRFRLLDKRLSVHTGGLDDLSIPLASFVKLPEVLTSEIRQIYITENKINGLSFPDCPAGLVIFGLGYGIESLARVPWLKDKDIRYWGDIDTHGFAILSRLRQFYPQTQSCLMDRSTLLACRDLWGQEADSVRLITRPESLNLDDAECQVYRDLLNNTHAKNLRLEQERIPLRLLLDVLSAPQR